MRPRGVLQLLTFSPSPLTLPGLWLITALALLLIFIPPAAAKRGGSSVTRGGVFLENEEGEPTPVYLGSYALVIGVSEYRHWRKLPGVKKDVTAVTTALKNLGFDVTVVIDPDRKRLYDAYSDFINKYGRNPEHRLLFYFAGHGHTEKLAYGGDMGYIVPIDAPDPRTSPDAFKSTAMDMRQFEVFARQVESRHAMFVFDSCFSGSVFSMGARGSLPLHLRDRAAKPVRIFLTSGSATEPVPDESIFRQQLIAGLGGEADSNHDGYVTGAELGAFLQDQVIRYSDNAQHPQFGYLRDPFLDKGEILFDLGTHPPPERPAPVAAAPPPPEQKSTLVLRALPPAAAFQLDEKRIDIPEGAPLQLPAGQHQVGFVSHLKKRLVRKVSLEPDESLYCRAVFTKNKVECQAFPFPEPPSKVGVALTATFAVSSLTFAGIYGYGYAEGSAAVDVTSDEADRILRTVRIGRSGAAISAAAAVTSGIITWLVRPHPRGGASKASAVNVNVAGGPDELALAVEMTW